MQLCLNTSTIQPQSLLDKIRIAAVSGYDGVELWLNDIYEHIGRGGEVREIEQALSDHGLTVPCTIAIRGWGDALGREYQLMLDEARRRMELATRIGSPWIVATPPREPCNAGQLTERYGDLLEIGRQIGVRPTLEYISFFRGLPTLDAAWEIVQTVNSDATLIVDAFHTWNSRSDAQLLQQIPAERISHYHVNDAHPDKPSGTQTDPDRVMIGDGPIDLAAEIQFLRKIGYKGMISLELFNADLWQQDPIEVASQGLQRLRQLLQ